MGVECQISLASASEEAAAAAAAQAFAFIAEIEQEISHWLRDSPVSRLNRGEQINPPEHLQRVIDLSLNLKQATDGAFDAARGRTYTMWRQAIAANRLPSGAQRAEAAGDSPSWDFSGVGKGYAAQLASERLTELGHPAHLIDFAGDLIAAEPPQGQPAWRVLIEGVGRADLVNTAVATSGATYAGARIGGKHYSHIIDPRTGEPVEHEQQVTVFAPNGAVADGLATAVSVLGVEAFERIAHTSRSRMLDRVGVLIRTPEGETLSTGDVPPIDTDNVPPAGFVALFNGRDLSGWRGRPADPPAARQMNDARLREAQTAADEAVREAWVVEDGVLHFRGGWDSLITQQEFADFELRMDWKVAEEGDSGVYLWATPQVQIWDNPLGSGGLYNNQNGGNNPDKVADAPVGEWNTFRILAVDGVVTVDLNGVRVIDAVPLENYWDRASPVYEQEAIWLQAHDSPLWFRNIFLREISNREAAGPGSTGGRSDD